MSVDETELKENVELKVDPDEAPADLPSVAEAVAPESVPPAEEPPTPPNPPMSTDRKRAMVIQLVLGFWLAACGLTGAAQNGWGAYAEYSLRDHPKFADAKVTRVGRSWVWYSYQDQAQKSHKAWEWLDTDEGASVKVGDTKQIRYSPEDPNHWAFTNSDIQPAGPFAYACMSLLASGIGLIYASLALAGQGGKKLRDLVRAEKENPNESGYRKWKRAQRAKNPKTRRLTPQIFGCLCLGAIFLGLGLNSGYYGIVDKVWKQHQLDTQGVVTTAKLTEKHYYYGDPILQYTYYDQKKGEFWRNHEAASETDYNKAAIGTDTREIKYLPADPEVVQWVGEGSEYKPRPGAYLWAFVDSIAGLILLGSSFAILCGKDNKPNKAARRGILITERCCASMFFLLSGLGVIGELIGMLFYHHSLMFYLFSAPTGVILFLTIIGLSWWRAAGRRYEKALAEIEKDTPRPN